MRIEWRRDEPTTAAAAEDGGGTQLASSIRAEIAARGPITFARFMELALYDPSAGYYTLATTRPTSLGDFVTAPELNPIFGRTLAGQIDEMWRRLEFPDDFRVREYGAGTGALFVSIVHGLARLGSALADVIRYEPIDFARQRAEIVDRLTQLGRQSQLVPLSESNSKVTGVVLANEYLDALPVHRVIKLNGELREIHVDWRDEAFTEVAGPLTDDRLATWFADAKVELAEGQRAEVNLAMLKWLRTLGQQMARGFVIAIDYGHAAAELYDAARRPTGTIRSFAAQRVSSDVLSEPGSRDITSSVDFDAFEREARACGFEVVGRRKSNEFLIASGLDETYAQARAETADDRDAALNLRSAIQRLLDPNALGGYLVSILAKDAPVDPALRGFQPLGGKSA